MHGKRCMTLFSFLLSLTDGDYLTRRFLLLQADIGMIKREMRWIDLSQSWPKNSKSSALWCYRRWVVGQEERMMGEDAGLWRWREDRWGKEREACRRACERHARNYAAWTYRLHLLPEAPGEDMEAPGKMMQRGRILDGLEQEERFSQAWTEEHLVDSSGWNYRRAVLARRSTWDSGFRVVDREVRRVQEMLDRYPGHQVLWNHLQLCLVPPILGQDEKEGNETWRDTLQRTIEWIKGKCTVPQQERWALTALIFLYRQIPDSLVGLIHEDQVQNEWVMRMIRSSSHPSSETKEPFTRANEYHHQTPPHHPMLQARQEQARILMTRQCARKREA